MMDEKYLKMCNLPSLNDYLEMYGNSKNIEYVYYDTFLIQSDRRVLQHLREKSLGIQTSLTEEEYLELENCRQFCVEKIRALKG